MTQEETITRLQERNEYLNSKIEDIERKNFSAIQDVIQIMDRIHIKHPTDLLQYTKIIERIREIDESLVELNREKAKYLSTPASTLEQLTPGGLEQMIQEAEEQIERHHRKRTEALLELESFSQKIMKKIIECNLKNATEDSKQ